MAEGKSKLEWVGEGELSGGFVQYESVLMDNVCISLGDHVAINAGEEIFGVVKELRESQFSGDKDARIQCYSTSSEIEKFTSKNRLENLALSSNELVLTDRYNLISVEAIDYKITVNQTLPKIKAKNCYKCVRYLNTEQRVFRPISNTAQSPRKRTGTERSLPLPSSPTKKRCPRQSKDIALYKMNQTNQRTRLSTSRSSVGSSNRTSLDSTGPTWDSVDRTPETSPNDCMRERPIKARRSLIISDDSSTHSSDTEGPLCSPKKRVKPVARSCGKGAGSARSAPAHKTTKVLSSCVPLRESKAVGRGKKQYDSLKDRLHVSMVPDVLPCRGTQFTDVCSFVESKLANGESGCMYISGVPGTGKTATVHEVSRHLLAASTEGCLPKFRFIEINGLRLTEPRQAYVEILKQLKGEKTTANKAAAILEDYFCNAPVKRKKKGTGRESILLLADELDMLWTRKQSILYDLFDWPSHPRAKLIVLAIANTMDLPERVMINRVSSRLGLTRLTFQPYTHQQLQEIIVTRLKHNTDQFTHDATEMAARKVASVSGDARRALDICRRAVEIAAEIGREGDRCSSKRKRPVKGSVPVGMTHVTAAVNEMFSSPIVKAIRSCSLYQKIFLRALMAELSITGMEEATIRSVLRHIESVCKTEGYPLISSTQVVMICNALAAMRIILIQSGRSLITRRVRLNVTKDSVYFALKEH